MNKRKNIQKRAIAFVFAIATSTSFITESAYALENSIDPVVETTMEETTEGDFDNAGLDDITTESVYEGDGYRVTFTLDGIQDGGFCANVKIDNTGEETIEDWMIAFDYMGDISNIWNASFLSTEMGNYIVKNNEWNQDIPVGGSVTFGISNNENFAGFPTYYHMMSKMNLRSSEDYAVSYEVIDPWESGFTANVTITNYSETAIEDWILGFDFNANITNIWGGEILSCDEGHYVIKNANHNFNIPAGETITFGIQASYAEDVCEPENFELYFYGLVEENYTDSDMKIVMNAYSKLRIGFAEGNIK